jgi:multidrug efflux pump subunit AcrA (membrane-fusion protein)
LFDQQIAQQQLRRAEARVEVQVHEIRRLEDLLARSEVHAPFDGQVAACYLTPGAVVQQGTPLIRLIARDELIIRFAAPASAVEQITQDAWVCFRELEQGSRIGGRVSAVSPEIDPALELVIVEARVDGDASAAKVVPGLAGFVALDRCVRGAAPDSPMLPEETDH